MNVLVVGSGGREHALTWKLKKSPLLTKLYVWPGNAATFSLAEKLLLDHNATYNELANECLKQKIDLVVVGPEGPLSNGIADCLTEHGIKVFGPKRRAAELESSKAFAKSIMMEAGIPTAAFEICADQEATRKVANRIFERDGGVVLKASALAAGKGVFVCQTKESIDDGIRRLYSGELAQSSTQVVVEEMLFGRECSYFCFLGSAQPKRLGFAVDHKRLKVGDKGPNTGGMGCYTPVPWLPDDAGDQIDAKIVEPLVATLSRHGIRYTGCLYVGVMWSDRGPSVVEFNVRFGDPEAQVLALSDQEDWLPLMLEQVGGTPVQSDVSKSSIPVLGYILASSGYPFGETKDIHKTIPRDLLSNDQEESKIFLASVKAVPEGVETGSGRVFLVAGAGKSFSEAKSNAMERIEKIRGVWPECQWRSDIGSSVILQETTQMNSGFSLPIILGSSSPRRKELLSNLGLKFEVIKPLTEEVPKPNELPVDYVQRNSFEKSQWICDHVRTSHPMGCLVITADTIVVIKDKLLEKPLDADDARRMLMLLSGQTHTVYTAVHIVKTGPQRAKDMMKSLLVATEVKIKFLSSQEIAGYIKTGEPFDKAGGYAAQGLGSFMTESIRGSFTNIVGLPSCEVATMLTNDFGVPLWGK